MAKTEKYKMKQKEKFVAKINATQSYVDAYKIAAKRGDLDILEELIEEVEERAKFINDMWTASIDDQEKAFDFASKIGIQELSSRYNPNLAKKIELLQEQGKMKFFDVMMLVNMNDGIGLSGKTHDEISTLKNEQAEKISYLLDVFTDPELEVGIHRTGGLVKGHEIKSKGLYLTGDLSSGVVNNITGEGIKETLDRNVSFYRKNPGFAVSQVCTGRTL